MPDAPKTKKAADEVSVEELERVLTQIYSRPLTREDENGVKTDCSFSDMPPLTQVVILYDFIGHGKFSDKAITALLGDDVLNAFKQLDERATITGDVNLPTLKTYQTELDDDQPQLPLDFQEEKKSELKTYHTSKKAILEIPKLLIDGEVWGHLKNVNGKPIKYNVASRRSEEKIYVFASLTSDPNAPKPVTSLTPFERRVENAVGNLYNDGYKVITSRMIFFQMIGHQTNDVSPKMLERIERAMLKLEATWVKIDYTEQWRAYNKKPNDKDRHIRFTKVVAYDREEVINEYGKLVQGAYILKKIPEFFGYSQEIGQIFTFPTLALDIPGASATEQIIVLTGIMLEHLALRQRKGGGNIRLDTILSKLDLENATKDQKINVIGNVRKIITHWKSIGVLRNPPQGQPDEIKNGNEIVGFAIYPKKQRGRK